MAYIHEKLGMHGGTAPRPRQENGWDPTKHPRSVRIGVPEKVLRGLERCREDGSFNMGDFSGVQWLASEFKEYATVVWMQNNHAKYMWGIFCGFGTEEDEEEDRAKLAMKVIASEKPPK